MTSRRPGIVAPGLSTATGSRGGHFLAQLTQWFSQVVSRCMVFGWVTAARIVLLFWGLLTIGVAENQPIRTVDVSSEGMEHVPA